MALNVNVVDSTLQIRYVAGVDQNGRTIIRTRNYQRVKPEAQDQDVMDVAKAINGLQSLQVSSIRRINEAEMVEV